MAPNADDNCCRTEVCNGCQPGATGTGVQRKMPPLRHCTRPSHPGKRRQQKSTCRLVARGEKLPGRHLFIARGKRRKCGKKSTSDKSRARIRDPSSAISLTASVRALAPNTSRGPRPAPPDRIAARIRSSDAGARPSWAAMRCGAARVLSPSCRLYVAGNGARPVTGSAGCRAASQS